MKCAATIKIPIQAKFLGDMAHRFLTAVQVAVDKGFEAKVTNRYALHRLVYKDLRQWLPADFACEAIAKASENLKSVFAIAKRNKTTPVRPVLKSCPITFNRNLFTFQADNLRVATFTPRQRQDIQIDVPEYYWKYLDWRYQSLEVMKDKKNRLFAHITFSREVQPRSMLGGTLGVDLGVNNLAVGSDGQVFTGHKTRIIQHQWLRKRLQAKGTKSARKHLREASGRQKRYMAWVNHNVSKQIVASADTIVLEDLTGIRKGNRKGKRFNRWLHSWSFFQLRQFIEYKAAVLGKKVVAVNPYMTSQTCSSCGEHGSRAGDSFCCLHCGFSSHADFNASCNLRRLMSTNQSSRCQSSGTSLASEMLGS